MEQAAAWADMKGSIVRTSLSDAVYEALLESIVTGRLPSGTVLSEIALAEQLDVSRTPVHDALRRLAHDGLVEQATNRKARVARFDESDVREVYEMRAVLEAQAAERACSRLSDDELHKLRHGIDSLLATADELDWPERAIEFDLRFHELLATACGNGRLARDIQRYRQLVRGFCRLSGSLANLGRALHEHAEILAALERRDARAAGEAMQRHIVARLDAVLLQLPAGRTSGE